MQPSHAVDVPAFWKYLQSSLFHHPKYKYGNPSSWCWIFSMPGKIIFCPPVGYIESLTSSSTAACLAAQKIQSFVLRFGWQERMCSSLVLVIYFHPLLYWGGTLNPCLHSTRFVMCPELIEDPLMDRIIRVVLFQCARGLHGLKC